MSFSFWWRFLFIVCMCVFTSSCFFAALLFALLRLSIMLYQHYIHQQINLLKTFETQCFHYNIVVHLLYFSSTRLTHLREKIGRDPLYKTSRNYGFGSYTGLAFPGESQGVLRKKSEWNHMSIWPLKAPNSPGVLYCKVRFVIFKN